MSSKAPQSQYTSQYNAQYPVNEQAAPLINNLAQQQAQQMMNQVQQQATQAAKDAGNQLAANTAALWEKHIGKMEGPKPLRVLCLLGGLALFVVSALGILNLPSLLFSPTFFILQMFEGMFGLMTIVIEAHNFPYLEKFQPVLKEWFKFLTVVGGRGVFYVFQGVLAISLFSLFDLIIGCYMVFVGVTCILIHFNLRQYVSTLVQQEEQEMKSRQEFNSRV